MLKKRSGFTLAEVLVTLAVIGVVASLTIPTLMKSYEKQQWITGYKGTFSIINQATRMVMADNGGSLLGAWGAAGNDEGMYNKYLPYLKVIKSCENQNPMGSCFASGYNRLNGLMGGMSGTFSVILSNGVALAFSAYDGANSTGDGNTITVDINGKKGPNVIGKDLHFIEIFITSDPVKPQNHFFDDATLNSDCPSDLGSGQGVSCGVRILRGDYGEDY